MSQNNRLLAVVIALALAATTMPTAWGQANPGGGSVNNVAPTVESFTNTAGTDANVGTTDTLTADVKDRNKETDIESVTFRTTSAPSGQAVDETCTVSGVDFSLSTTEPLNPNAGACKAWNPDGTPDGEITVTFKTASYQEGQYVWTVDVTDDDGLTDTAATPITIDVVEAFTIAADPVLADDSADTGARWGAWTANPGDPANPDNVESSNFLKVENTGSEATVSFTIDFTPAAFSNAGVSDTIDIDGNIQFACDEVTAGQAPSDGTFVYEPTDADGAITLGFTGLGNLIYCKYQIVDIPEVIADTDYSAGYTVA